MELHELDVPQFRAGPGGQRQAVAGQPGRVGGGRVGLAEAAGGQHDRGRGHRADPQDPVRWPAIPATTPPTAPRSPVRASSATQWVSTWTRLASRAARRTRCTSAPIASPPALTIRLRLCPPSRCSAVRSSRAPRAASRAISPGRLGDQRRHGRRIAQARARVERVPLMQRRGVPRTDGGGQAALGQRRRAPADPVLAEQQHPAAAAGRGQRGGEPAAPEPTTTTSVSRAQRSGDRGRRRSSAPVSGHWPRSPGRGAGRGPVTGPSPRPARARPPP